MPTPSPMRKSDMKSSIASVMRAVIIRRQAQSVKYAESGENAPTGCS